MAPKFYTSSEILHFQRSEDGSQVDRYYGNMWSAADDGDKDDDDRGGASATNDDKNKNDNEEAPSNQCYCWVVGDLVAFSTDPQKKQNSPYDLSVKDPTTRVGQVLAFLVRQRPSNDREPTTYCAVVRHLLPWGAACTVLNRGEQNTVQSHCRGKLLFGLLETNETSVIRLDQIDVSRDITVLGSHPESDAKKLGLHPKITPSSPSLAPPLRKEWVLDQVYGSFEDNQLTLYSPKLNDWANDGYRIKYSNVVPAPLRRGWRCLRSKALRQNLWEKLLPAVQQERELLPCADASPDDMLPAPEDLEGDGDDFDGNDDNGTTSQRPQEPSVARDGTKRKPELEQGTRERSPKQLKRRRPEKSADFVEGAEEPQHSLGQPSEPTAIEVSAPSPPVFTLRPSKSVTITHPLMFYTHVNVTTNVNAWLSWRPTTSHGNAGRKKLTSALPIQPPPHWTVNVGDVVIVSSDLIQGGTPRRITTKRNSPGSGSSNKWHPFTSPWEVAQVLSIYQSSDNVADPSQVSEGDPPVSGTTGEWRMEVRWFHRPDDMTTFNVEMPEDYDPTHSVVEIDEYVETIPVGIVLGRARLTSSSPPNELGVSLGDDGVLTYTFLCRHIYVSQFDERTVRHMLDWAPNYGYRLAGPLSRALLCEKAWPGKRCAKRLRKAYTKFLTQRFQLTDTILNTGIETEPTWDDEVSLASGHDISRKSWPAALSDSMTKSASQIILSWSDLYRLNDQVFLSSILLRTCLKRFDARATAKKSESQAPWRLAVGDCVCLAYDNLDHVPPPTTASKNPWYPFQGPWKVAQVLSMYHDCDGTDEPMGSRTDRTLLEVRLFHRPCEVSADTRLSLPPMFDDEVLESEVVEQNVAPCRILSRCIVRAAHQSFKDHVRFQGVDQDEPELASHEEVTRRTRFLILSDRQRCIPVFSSTSDGWSRGLVQRGAKFSKFTQGASSESLDWDVQSEGASSPSLPTDHAQPRPLGDGLYLSTPVVPQWESFNCLDLICPPEERPVLKWVVKVGDLVAVPSAAIHEYDSFPLLVSWKPCQILALWREHNEKGPLKATVQWLLCERSQPDTNKLQKDKCQIGSPSSVGTVDVASFLCPLTVLVNKTIRIATKLGPEFLPSALVELTSSYDGDVEEIFSDWLVTGINVCPRYSVAMRAKVFRVLGVSSSFADGSGDVAKSRDAAAASGVVAALGPPILTVTSVNLNFHVAARVATPETVFDTTHFHNSWRGEAMNWEVRLGDVVAVKARGRGRRLDVFPFTLPWRIAEVVTIFEQSSSGDTKASDAGVQIEVRWFYRPDEVFHKSRGSASSHTASATLPELFESDHYEVIPGCCLLAPVVLEARFDSQVPNDQDNGTNAALRFTCGQFWSHHRKSLVPIGSLEGRISRGRSQSKYFGKYDALQAACAAIPPQRLSDSHANAERNANPEEAFESVIDKLSLTDASKEALHEVSGIVGREPEKKVISSFLQDAVFGSERDRKAFTLLLAGSPGVGKTVCVRACINEAKRRETETARFDFFIVNGMELRNPDDAYTLMWEEVSPDRDRGSPAWARVELEKYFTCPPTEGTNPAGGRCKELERVVVVLVDEIDYLVTKKQGLIYDIFDWPVRAIYGRRLVVIGVSNTINLPERLHPRVRSRITKHYLFKAYSDTEISDIVRAKVAQASPNFEVFTSDAISFVSKKTATTSGDVRRAFRILRAAAEMILTEVEMRNSSVQPHALKVGIGDVVKVSRDSFTSAQCKGVALLAPYEALFLVALTCLSKWTGREQGAFDLDEILTKMKAMANALGDERYLPPPTLDEALEIVTRLGEARVVGLSTSTSSSTSHRPGFSGGGGPWPLVNMVMDDSTVCEALRKTENRELALKILQVTGGDGA